MKNIERNWVLLNDLISWHNQLSQKSTKKWNQQIEYTVGKDRPMKLERRLKKQYFWKYCTIILPNPSSTKQCRLLCKILKKLNWKVKCTAAIKHQCVHCPMKSTGSKQWQFLLKLVFVCNPTHLSRKHTHDWPQFSWTHLFYFNHNLGENILDKLILSL